MDLGINWLHVGYTWNITWIRNSLMRSYLSLKMWKCGENNTRITSNTSDTNLLSLTTWTHGLNRRGSTSTVEHLLKWTLLTLQMISSETSEWSYQKHSHINLSIDSSYSTLSITIRGSRNHIILWWQEVLVSTAHSGLESMDIPIPKRKPCSTNSISKIKQEVCSLPLICQTIGSQRNLTYLTSTATQ